MQTFVVTTELDGGAGSLRDAIEQANANLGDDVIVFADDIDTIALLAALPEITDELTIEGGGGVTVDGNTDGDGDAATSVAQGAAATASRSVFEVASGRTVTFDGLTITGGNAAAGGGVRADNATVTFVEAVVRDNFASLSGGGVSASNGAVTLINSSVEVNRAVSGSSLFPAIGGGGIEADNVVLIDSTVRGNSTDGEGAGIRALGSLAMTASTVSGNAADLGGGISAGDATLTNSTVSGNTAESIGGIFTNFDLTMVNSTVTGNSAFDTGGVAVNGLLTLTDSIVSGNAADRSGDDIDPSDTPLLQGGNIVGGTRTVGDAIEETGLTAGDIFAGTVDLGGGKSGGALANNGGPTETVLIAAGGAAQDAGGPTTLTTDQRGEARPVGDNDLGAVELQAAPEPGSLIVTIAADIEDAFDNETSLREAIAFANSEAGADTITFAAGVETIALRDALPEITGDLTIDGAGLVTVDGDTDGDADAATSVAQGAAAVATRSVFEVAADQSATFDGLTITGGNATVGGGVRADNATVTFVEAVVRDNFASLGGGGVSAENGAVTLIDSTVEGNRAVSGSSSFRGDGGGIEAGDVTLIGSTVRGNSADGAGGGIRAIGSLATTASTVSGNAADICGGISAGDATLTNSTVSGNTADSVGGIFTNFDLTMVNSTVTGNSATDNGGVAVNGLLTLTDSIVSGNAADNFGDDIDPDDAVAYQGGNIVGSAIGANGAAPVEVGLTADDIFAGTVDLGGGKSGGALANNGGPTETVLIAAGGAAQDAGGPTTLTTDQRGEARPVGPANDLGAVELQRTPEPGSLVVTIEGDIEDAFDGETSLREAIQFANDQAGADTITFSADFDGGAEDLIRLTMGQLNITDAVTIDGGAAGVTISGDTAGDDITVAGGGITDARASYDGNVFQDNSRVFQVGATTTLTGLTITGGAATGAVFFDQTGGGVKVVAGNLTLERSEVVGNIAAPIAFFEGKGGGVFAGAASILRIVDSAVTGNLVDAVDGVTGLSTGAGLLGSGGGGGVWAENEVELSGSLISDNFASVVTVNGLAGGGGVFGGDVRVDDSDFINNTFVTTSSGSGTRWGGGGLRAEFSAEISGSRFIGNAEINPNGGGNIPSGGGGLSVDGGSMTGSEVSGNFSAGEGGGLKAFDTFRIENSTIANNTSTLAGGGVWGQQLTVVNGTITGNRSDASTGGRGVDASALSLTDSLVLGNSGTGPEVVSRFEPTQLTGGNVIGAERSVDGVVVETVEAADVFQTVVDNNGVDAGALADNGGPSRTVLIKAGGAAQDTGLETPQTEADQRGEARPFGPAGDIGAVELQEGPPEIVADSHIEFDTTKLALAGGGKPNLVQVALHTGDLNGIDDLEYSSRGTKAVEDDVFGGVDEGGTLLASELYQRRGGGRFEDDSLAPGDLAQGVQDIGGWKTREGEALDPLLADILAIDAFKLRQDADEAPDSFVFAGGDADGTAPGGQTVLKGGQGLRAQSSGFGVEFGIDRNGAGKPDFGGDGGPTKEIAGPELMLFTLAEGLVGTGVSFGVDRAGSGEADVALDFYALDRTSETYTLIERRTVRELDDGAPTGPDDALADLGFAFDAVAFSAADGDRFRLEMLEIGTFADLG